jgi:hypothetical protein
LISVQISVLQREEIIINNFMAINFKYLVTWTNLWKTQIPKIIQNEIETTNESQPTKNGYWKLQLKIFLG